MRTTNISENFKISEYYSKLTVVSALQLLCYILWIPFVILTNISFKDYGWGVNNPDISSIPVNEQCFRLWLLLFTSLIILTSCFCLYFSIRIFKYDSRNWKYLLGIGIFSWVFLVYLLIIDYNYRFISIYREYLNFHVNNNYQVSFIHLFTGRRWDKLTRNTILYIFSFLICLVGVIFVMIPDPDKSAYLDKTFIFHSLSYFTRLTNIGCFLTLAIFCFIQTRTYNKNHTFTIYMCSYILIVALVYWLVLFPQNMVNGSFQKKSPYSLTETIWLHLITPTFFIAFIINSYTLSLQISDRKILKHLFMINIYPLWYFSYAYFIPFFAKESVYGFITNLNPDGYVYSSDKFVQNGHPAYVLTIFIFGLIFILAFLLFRIINIKIYDNKCFYQNKVAIY